VRINTLQRTLLVIVVAALSLAGRVNAQESHKDLVRVAIGQILVIDGDRPGNFRRIENALDRARALRADLIVFPESVILGWENPDAYRLAQPIPGDDSRRIGQLARHYGLMILIGLDEKAGASLYDSAILVNKEGRLLWKHRKINARDALMSPPYAAGSAQDIGVVSTELGRLALLICADTFTDSHLDRLKALHPDLLLVPYGWAAPVEQWPEHSKELENLVRRRAAELAVPLVGVNSVGEMTHGSWKGQLYGGSSFVADAHGNTIFAGRDRDTDLQVVEIRLGSR